VWGLEIFFKRILSSGKISIPLKKNKKIQPHSIDPNIVSSGIYISPRPCWGACPTPSALGCKPNMT
jgi:hypothetical protein